MSLWERIDRSIEKMTATATARGECSGCAATLYAYDNEPLDLVDGLCGECRGESR